MKPPTKLTATSATDNSVALEWERPTDSTGVLGYQVRWRLKGTSNWVNARMRPQAVLTGLQPNTDYEFDVMAVGRGTFSLSATIAARTEPPPSTGEDDEGTTAFRIADMMERFGVNTFSSVVPDANVWGSWPADYTSTSVVAAIRWLTSSSGLRMNVREFYYANGRPWQIAWCRQVHEATDALFTIAIGANGSPADATALAAVADSVNSENWLAAIEGINEPNNDFGFGPINQDLVVGAQMELDKAGDVDLRVMTPSVVFGLPHPGGWITPGYLSFAQRDAVLAHSDMYNAHVYPPSHPDAPDGSSYPGAMADIMAELGTIYLGKPMAITEWHPTLYNTQGHKLDPAYDCYYAPAMILDAFRFGAWGVFWFALFDYGTEYLSGLFPKSGGADPRPVAWTIRAMYDLTGDYGADKHTFTPGKLNYTVENLPFTGRHMLFQNSAGRYFLYVWNTIETPGGDAASITVRFSAHAMHHVAVFEISDVDAPARVRLARESVSEISIPLRGSVHLFQIDY